MTVYRLAPFDLMTRLSHDLERLAAVAPGHDDLRQNLADWAPAVDICEKDDQFTLHADLPGVASKDIEVTLEKGVLTLRGSRALEPRDPSSGLRRAERTSGKFHRSFNLPKTADAEAVKARFTNGVLEVTIPKHAEVLARRIEVEAA